MLNAETKTKLKNKLYPTVDQITTGSVHRALDQHLQPGIRVLDAGCGKGSGVLRKYRQRMGLLVGVDKIAPKEGYGRMDEFILSELDDMPFPDATFDVVICYEVIEHLRNPQKVFAEFRRILIDGGVLIFKTPCAISPLFFFSRFSPFLWHQKIKKVLLGVQESHVFPTYYRCNTLRKMDHTLRAEGFQKEMLESIEETHCYLVFSKVAYCVGLLLSRLVQVLRLAKPFRSQLIGVYRKLGNCVG